jgi:hypothetical protein
MIMIERVVSGSRLNGWLPIEVNIRGDRIVVRWMRVQRQAFQNPFFHQSIATLRQIVPPVSECVTDINCLLEIGRQFASAVPQGLIFHVSRCGSTLISNVLRRCQGAIVLSEAEPLNFAVRPYVSRIWPFPADRWEDVRKELLQSFVAAFAMSGSVRDTGVVVKFSSTAIVNLRFVRTVWPDVPVLIVVRDPVEVIVSNLLSPGGWLQMKRFPLLASEAFGFNGLDIREMSVEEYCSRVLGLYCFAALDGVSAGCRVIDYAAINEGSVRAIAEYFSLPQPPETGLRECLATDAKDLQARRTFNNDQARKQELAGERVRREVSSRVWDPYVRLLALQRW